MVYPLQFSDSELVTEHQNGLVLIGPKRYAYPERMKDLVVKFNNFQVRQEDVWIYGFPRTGTTITQEIVWLLENNLDFNKAKEQVLDLRFPILEREIAFDDGFFKIHTNNGDERLKQIANGLIEPATKQLEQIQGKRLIKTHLPFSLGPSNIIKSGCKVFYLTRNPKDVIVSSYNFAKSFKLFDDDFETYYNAFEAGLVYACPFFEHVKEGWSLRNHDNVLFLYYEDYNKNFRQTLIKIADFLGRSLTDEQLKQIEEHLKIDNFRQNKSVNNDHLRQLGIMKDEDDQFIRKGKCGGWSDYFTGPLLNRVNKWIDDNLKGTDLEFVTQ